MIELMLQAERALMVGMIDQAERLYEMAARNDPRNAIAVVGLARVALERNDDRGAYDLSRQALGIDRENAAALRLEARLSEVLTHRGEPVERPPFVLEQRPAGGIPTAGAGRVRSREPFPVAPRSDHDGKGGAIGAALRFDRAERAEKFARAEREDRAAQAQQRTQGWEPARMSAPQPARAPEPGRTDPGWTEPRRTDPGRTEPRRTDPGRAWSAPGWSTREDRTSRASSPESRPAPDEGVQPIRIWPRPAVAVPDPGATVPGATVPGATVPGMPAGAAEEHRSAAEPGHGGVPASATGDMPRTQRTDELDGPHASVATPAPERRRSFLRRLFGR